METERPEIIDLTDESPTPQNFVDLTSDHEVAVPPNSAPSEDGKKKHRKRKKKKTRTTENGQASVFTPTSTENMSNAASTSTSRRQDSSQLYFIDITPVPLPSPIAVQPPLETRESQTDTLLLPAHVAVFGNEHIQIVSLPQKEIGEEDYIEYLAYDDQKASNFADFSAPQRLKYSSRISRVTLKIKARKKTATR